MVLVKDVINHMNQLAPPHLAYKWDNIGLQVGDNKSQLENVLVTLDVTEEVIQEAVKKNCQLIVAHHPLIFKPLSAIDTSNYKARLLISAIKQNLNIFVAHTNLDMAEGGLNDYLASLLGIKVKGKLKKEQDKKLYKLIVFIPEDYLQKVRESILAAGAGSIGKYDYTSFSSEGEGTFRPLKGSNPHIGQKGHISYVKEKRLETIVEEDKIKQVVTAMLKAHPYEEVAYDLIPLPLQGESIGIGRIGVLKKALRVKDYLKTIKDKLSLERIKFVGNPETRIKKIAVLSGSGGDFVENAANSGVDLFVTGDIKYHQAQLAEETGLVLVDAGHYETEVIVKDLLYNYLKKKIDINIIKSEVDTKPW